jgi:hypothetical protein
LVAKFAPEGVEKVDLHVIWLAVYIQVQKHDIGVVML